MGIDPTGEAGNAFPGEDEVRPVLDQARSGILVTDATLEPPGPRIVYANPAFESITGYPPHELRGRSPRLLQGPGTEREVLDRLRAALTRGSSFFGRAWNYRRDGTPFVAEWSIAPLRDDHGRLTHFLSVQRDVTAEERTARALRESRDLLDRTAAVARVGGWEVDPETHAVQWTRVAAEIFEVPEDFEPTVERIVEYYPPDGNREAIRGAVTCALESGEGWDLELGIVTGAGRQRWVRVIGEPRVEEGRCTRLTGTVQDITARRVAEQARREAEERLVRISAHIPGFFYQLRCTGQGEILELRFVSSGIERLFGLSAEGVRRDPAGWFERVHPEDRAWLDAHPPRAWERDTWSVRYRIAVAGHTGEQGYEWVEDSATREALGDDQCLWHGLVMQIGDRKAMEDKLRRQAHYDPLTGLANRTLLRLRLQEEIDRARAGGTGVAVLYLDLDEFKYINDAWGHAVGDRLLRAVADRVAACFRSDDHVARIGGDEMIVLGPGVGSAAGARDLAERVLRAFEMPFEVDDTRFDVSASIGISLYPADDSDLDALLANADAALYAAKHDGGSRYAFYSRELTASAAARVHIKTELRRALDAGAIEVAFQDIVTLDGRRVVGREALARWRNVAGEPIPPSRFIPVAESTAMIGELGDQVLARACAQAARWEGEAADAWLAVNVSPVQLDQPDFDVRVRHAAATAGLDPGRLVLEITEEAIAREDVGALDHLARLREAGVRIAVDDFGTGYASLKSLATLPVDHVKIDRHFVRDVDTDATQDAIVRTVVRLAESLGLTVTAEGVETENEAARVAALGCSRAQGFLFDEPRIPPV